MTRQQHDAGTQSLTSQKCLFSLPITSQACMRMCRKLLEFVRGGASLAHALAHSGVSAQVCKAQQEDAGRFLQDVHALLRALAVEDLAVQVHLTNVCPASEPVICTQGALSRQVPTGYPGSSYSAVMCICACAAAVSVWLRTCLNKIAL